MSEPVAVTYAVRDGIAVLTIENPPVNALSQAVRAGIIASLDKADADFSQVVVRDRVVVRRPRPYRRPVVVRRTVVVRRPRPYRRPVVVRRRVIYR